jgi:hypothetical protein
MRRIRPADGTTEDDADELVFDRLAYIDHDAQGTCPDRPDDGGDTFHCFHGLGEGLCVCCWCGDVFHDQDDIEPSEHGPYSRAGLDTNGAGP